MTPITHTSLVMQLAARSAAQSCDCCKRVVAHRVAIHSDGPPVMLCAGCYAAFDFDTEEQR